MEQLVEGLNQKLNLAEAEKQRLVQEVSGQLLQNADMKLRLSEKQQEVD